MFIVHELMHVLGFHHMHQYSHRAYKIRIRKYNISPDMMHDFLCLSRETFGL